MSLKRNRKLWEKLGANNFCKRNQANNRLAFRQLAQGKPGREESETTHLQGDPKNGLETS
jgi:hypothetical protein